jgi:hypothetical protein
MRRYFPSLQPSDESSSPSNSFTFPSFFDSFDQFQESLSSLSSFLINSSSVDFSLFGDLFFTHCLTYLTECPTSNPSFLSTFFLLALKKCPSFSDHLQTSPSILQLLTQSFDIPTIALFSKLCKRSPSLNQHLLESGFFTAIFDLPDNPYFLSKSHFFCHFLSTCDMTTFPSFAPTFSYLISQFPGLNLRHFRFCITGISWAITRNSEQSFTILQHTDFFTTIRSYLGSTGDPVIVQGCFKILTKLTSTSGISSEHLREVIPIQELIECLKIGDRWVNRGVCAVLVDCIGQKIFEIDDFEEGMLRMLMKRFLEDGDFAEKCEVAKIVHNLFVWVPLEKLRELMSREAILAYLEVFVAREGIRDREICGSLRGVLRLAKGFPDFDFTGILDYLEEIEEENSNCLLRNEFLREICEENG